MKSILVVDSPRTWPLNLPGAQVVGADDYLTNSAWASDTAVRVFNMCRSYKYQTTGYYTSLLAEARGHRPLPSVTTLQDMQLAPLVRMAGEDSEALVQKLLGPLKGDRFELSIYFGANVTERYNRLARLLFSQFPAPFLRAVFVREGSWRLESLRIIGAAEIPDTHRPFVIEQSQRYFDRPTRRARPEAAPRYDLAILYDPNDPMPPSDEKAIRKFCKAAESLGMRPTVIGADGYGRIAEFDALFIRETTFVNHHTYRFSRRADAEGMVVIDDPASIVRCTNKVYLAEVLNRAKVPTPRTIVVSRATARRIPAELGFPCVLKQPDSSFSNGVTRIDTEADFDTQLDSLFATTELIVAQEYMPTDFDWRVGVLGGEPLFVCRYHMARNHWQIIKRDAKGVHEGKWDAMELSDAPAQVLQAGVRAARLIGNGLYGVDIKTVGKRAVVIEVNDNPSLDSGVEDLVLGDELYMRIMKHIFAKLEQRHA